MSEQQDDFDKLIKEEVAVTIPISIDDFMNIRAFLLIDKHRPTQDRHILYKLIERIYEKSERQAVALIKEYNSKHEKNE